MAHRHRTDLSAVLQAGALFASDRKTAMSMLDRVGLAVSGYDDEVARWLAVYFALQISRGIPLAMAPEDFALRARKWDKKIS